LLFLYFGVVALRQAYDDPARGDRSAALLALVGVINVPIIHFSVEWWNSLHQGATVAKFGKPAMPGSMLWPLLAMFLGFMLFFGAVLCMRLRAQILQRERSTQWLKEAL
jgi:heme exporter protein C